MSFKDAVKKAKGGKGKAADEAKGNPFAKGGDDEKGEAPAKKGRGGKDTPFKKAAKKAKAKCKGKKC